MQFTMYACNLPSFPISRHHGVPFGGIDQPSRSLRQHLRGVPGVLSPTVECLHTYGPKSARKHASSEESDAPARQSLPHPEMEAPMEADGSQVRWKRSLARPWMSRIDSANRSSSNALRNRLSWALSRPEPDSTGFAAPGRNGGASPRRQYPQTSRRRGLKDALVIGDEDRIELSDPKCACKL